MSEGKSLSIDVGDIGNLPLVSDEKFASRQKAIMNRAWLYKMRETYGEIDKEIYSAIQKIRTPEGQARALMQFAAMFWPKFQSVEVTIDDSRPAPEAKRFTEAQLINVIDIAKGDKGKASE